MQREVEIKFFIDNKTELERIRAKLFELYPKAKTKPKLLSGYYYKAVSVSPELVESFSKLGLKQFTELKKLFDNSSELVIKARSINGNNQISIKGSAAGTDPVHAVNRLEFEEETDASLAEIDEKLQAIGLELVAKWYSDRKTYLLDENLSADLEFASGYGYKGEIEILTDDAGVDQAKQEIAKLAEQLGVEEVDPDFIHRAYVYYCDNWERFFDSQSEFTEADWVKVKA